LLTVLVYVQPGADDALTDDGQGDSDGGGAGEAGDDARTDEATIVAAATDVAEASRESKIPHEMEV
jgi:hypothetical protein